MLRIREQSRKNRNKKIYYGKEKQATRRIYMISEEVEEGKEWKERGSVAVSCSQGNTAGRCGKLWTITMACHVGSVRARNMTARREEAAEKGRGESEEGKKDWTVWGSSSSRRPFVDGWSRGKGCSHSFSLSLSLRLPVVHKQHQK